MPMSFRTVLAGRISAFAFVASITIMLAGCGEDTGQLTSRAYQPLSPEMLALMQDKGTTQEAPVLIRAYKQEAEFEVWKMKADGHYTLLKTYPMCRWSGQLGPKVREGDRQVPEGFYTITPGQMNPNSNYYLSFNVGYPNAYDRAHGRSGGSIMVHGACSSAGCLSMTDQQIAEIYSIAREAFAGGQRAIQMQSLPFHMTPENLAKYRLDPNIDFWKELKTGSDNFEVTGQEVAVGVCNGRYVFNAEPANGGSFEASGPCPPLNRDQVVEDEVLAKQKRDDARVAELAAEGVPAVHTVYADGGQNPSFASRRGDVSRPDALAAGPVDVAIDAKRKTPTLAQLEAAKAEDLAEAAAAEKKADALRAARADASGESGKPEPAQAVAEPQPQPANPPPAQPEQGTFAGSILTRLFTPQPQQPQPPAPAAQGSAEQQRAEQQTAEPAADGSETGFSRLYTATQPTERPAPAAEQAASASSAESDEAAQPADVPMPPLRKQRQAAKPGTVQDSTADGTPAEPDGAQQPALRKQTQAPNPADDDAVGGAMPIVPQGFSAIATPDR
jgi:murein L,D-transpeptidase YafK